MSLPHVFHMNLNMYGPGRNSPYAGTTKQAQLVATMTAYRDRYGPVAIAGFTEVLGTAATVDGTREDIGALGFALGMYDPRVWLVDAGFPTGGGREWVAICFEARAIVVSAVAQRYPATINAGTYKIAVGGPRPRRTTFDRRPDAWEPREYRIVPAADVYHQPPDLVPGHRMIVIVEFTAGETHHRIGFLHNRYTDSYTRTAFMDRLSDFLGGVPLITPYSEWDAAAGAPTSRSTRPGPALNKLDALGGDFNQNPPAAPPPTHVVKHIGRATTRAAEAQANAERNLHVIGSIAEALWDGNWPDPLTGLLPLAALTAAQRGFLTWYNPAIVWTDGDLYIAYREEVRLFHINNHNFDWYTGPPLPLGPAAIAATGVVPLNLTGSDHLGVGLVPRGVS